MKLKIEINEKDLEKSIDILNFIGRKTIDEIIFEFLNNEIYTSDILFLLLQKLSKDEKIISNANEIQKNELFSEEYKKELIEYAKNKLNKLSKKIFLTSLEISKFFQCQRRFFLEKVVHSKQKKEQKSYEGEVFHKSISDFIKNYNKYSYNLDILISLVSENVLEKYRGKVRINSADIRKTLFSIDNLIKKLNLKYIISEPLLISIKYGIIGTPDIIAVTQDNEILPIEIKTNVKKIKKGLKVQLAGEAFVAEAYFRKEIKEVMLLSLNNRKIFKIKITDEDRKLILSLLRSVKKNLFLRRIPPMSSLPNFRKVVCPYCHVKEVCDFIEEIHRILKFEKQKIDNKKDSVIV